MSLALQVTGTVARSWVLRVRVAGKQREMGLGGFPAVTLAEAREKARGQRAKVEQGADPILARRAAQQTFATVGGLHRPA